MKLGRRSLFKFLGLAPLAPVAVDLAAKALASGPAKLSADMTDWNIPKFTIPPQPSGIGGLHSYSDYISPARFEVTGGFYASGTPKTAHVWQNNEIESAGGKS